MDLQIQIFARTQKYNGSLVYCIVFEVLFHSGHEERGRGDFVGMCVSAVLRNKVKVPLASRKWMCFCL